ncbi:MAG: TolC family protein, partial [Parafilimonas terrae]|nr:TolC family protein [Parafilimonas terrae]
MSAVSLTKPAHRAALRSGRLAATALAVTLAAVPACAETLEGALARAYRGNPALNASRATTRYTDEGVAIAQSGYRPQVAVSADIGQAYSQGRFSGINVNQTLTPGGAGLTVNQTIFNGFQTDNNVRRAESTVYSQRETLRFTELTTLYNAVQAYMNVLSNTATLELNRNNVEVLEEQLRQTRDRFNVGEVTRTDVAQAEARLAGARSQVSAAESALRTSIGIYRQNIGVEPRSLA